MSDIEELTKKVEKYIKKNLSELRYSHSVRVAEMCVEIAELCGYDVKKARLAGISHDICKEIPKEKMLSLVQKSSYEITAGENQRISLLHGKAGAVFLKEKFDVSDEDVLEAVANHVTGIADGGILSKIIYIADKNERGREHVTDEFVKYLYSMSVDEMFVFTARQSYDYLKAKKGFIIVEDTYKLLDALGIER